MALQVRTQLGDLYLSDALPAIYEVIQNEYDQYPDLIPTLFNVESSGRSIEQSTMISGFGRMVETPEGQPVNTDIAYQRYNKTYTHLKYTLGYKVSREMIDDDQFGIVGKFSKSLAKSAFDTRQFLAADIFNQGFVTTFYTGGDGLAFFVTNHTLTSGTSSNALTTPAALSVTSLRQALVDIAATVDERGLLINLTPKMLLVPPALQFDAQELLKSPDRPDTAARAINAFSMKNMDWTMWPYLTSGTAWFIGCDRHDLTWFDRKEFAVDNFEDYSTHSLVIQGHMRLSRGWNDWRGWYGTAGA